MFCHWIRHTLKSLILLAAGLGGGVAWASLEVHFIDVGQGDAILLAGPDGSVLVDGGNANGMALDYLRTVGADHLDLVVASHAHADHIGGLTQILAAPTMSVGTLWYNGQSHTTVTFESFVDAVLERPEIAYVEPERGDIASFGDLVVTVLHPDGRAGEAGGGLHDQMIVLRVDYGDTALLLMGDAEAPIENELLRTGQPIESGLLKLGHHGSDTGTTTRFLDAAGPGIAVYQAGQGNRYGHPHSPVLDRLTAAGVAVYGTEDHGTVVAVSDGSGWKITMDFAEAAASCIDLNAADPVALTDIVHIGPGRAAALSDARPYQTVTDLGRVSGLGPSRVADIVEQGLACVQ